MRLMTARVARSVSGQRGSYTNLTPAPQGCSMQDSWPPQSVAQSSTSSQTRLASVQVVSSAPAGAQVAAQVEASWQRNPARSQALREHSKLHSDAVPHWIEVSGHEYSPWQATSQGPSPQLIAPSAQLWASV